LVALSRELQNQLMAYLFPLQVTQFSFKGKVYFLKSLSNQSF
jgi:hypothetical protein